MVELDELLFDDAEGDDVLVVGGGRFPSPAVLSDDSKYSPISTALPVITDVTFKPFKGCVVVDDDAANAASTT